MPNQAPVRTAEDGSHFRNLNQIYSLVRDFCRSENLHFCHNIPSDLEEIKTDKIFYFWFGDMPSLTAWQQFDDNLTLHSKRAVAITDSIVEYKEYQSLTLFSCPDLLGLYFMHRPGASQLSLYDPKKLFNCFMQRIESVRQSWFYFLYLNQLIDKGYVSFLLYQINNYNTLVGGKLFEYIHYTYQLDKLPHFDYAYHHLKTLVPYKNFAETGSLESLIMDSKYSLILEGEAPDDDIGSWTFTEKVLRAVQYPCLNLFFVQRGAINKLEQLGFRMTLDLGTIDQLPWQQRQQHLLNYLSKDSSTIDLSHQIEVAEHNQNLLQSWYGDVMSPKYFDKFFTKILEI